MGDDSPPANAETMEVDSMSGDFTDEAEEYSLQPCPASGFPCEYCGKWVKTKNGLHKHKKRYHDNERRQLMKFICSEGCGTGFPHLNLLRSHYVAKHDLPSNQISAQFSSVEAFEHWKEDEEQTTCTKFVVKDRRSAGQKGRTRIMYWCHRSGEPSEPKNKSKPRSPRTAAKSGIICTAAINAFINVDGTVEINYFPEHWGHENDAQYLFLSKEQRQEIAQQLNNGVSPEEIVENCQNSDNIRLKKVTRAVVYRICRDFDIPWLWGKQEARSEAASLAAQNVAKTDDDTSQSNEEFEAKLSEKDSGSSGSSESLAVNQKQAIQYLDRIAALLLNGAIPIKDDLVHLQAVEERLHLQLTTQQELELATNCVVIIDNTQSAEPSSPPAAAAAASASAYSQATPRDLNVSIINYDGARHHSEKQANTTGGSHKPTSLSRRRTLLRRKRVKEMRNAQSYTTSSSDSDVEAFDGEQATQSTVMRKAHKAKRSEN